MLKSLLDENVSTEEEEIVVEYCPNCGYEIGYCICICEEPEEPGEPIEPEPDDPGT